MRRLILGPFCLLASLFCEASPSIRGYDALAQNYVHQHLELARRHAATRGILVSICLAQAMHESGVGMSTLAINANNHFGIKAHNDKVWKGEKFYLEDDDFDANGNKIKSPFRKYNSVEESFQDYANYLCSNPRYSKLLGLPKSDYRAWAHELSRAGYATDSTYALKLIEKIEKFELYRYDDALLVPESSIKNKNDIRLLFAHKPSASTNTNENPKAKSSFSTISAAHTSPVQPLVSLSLKSIVAVPPPPCPTPPQRLEPQRVKPIFLPIELKVK